MVAKTLNSPSLERQAKHGENGEHPSPFGRLRQRGRASKLVSRWLRKGHTPDPRDEKGGKVP